MPTLRWSGPGLFTDHAQGFIAHPGVHDVTDEQADSYLEHDGWERVDDAETAESTDDTGTVDPPFDPGDYTVSDDELADQLSSGDYSDDELDAIESAEQDGKDRETALEAIDDARGN